MVVVVVVQSGGGGGSAEAAVQAFFWQSWGGSLGLDLRKRFGPDSSRCRFFFVVQSCSVGQCGRVGTNSQV